MIKIKENELKDYLPVEYLKWVENEGIAFIKDNRFVFLMFIDDRNKDSHDMKITDIIDIKNKTILSNGKRIEIKGYQVFENKIITTVLNQLVDDLYTSLNIESHYVDILEAKKNITVTQFDSCLLKFLNQVRLFNFSEEMDFNNPKNILEAQVKNNFTIGMIDGLLDRDGINALNFYTDTEVRASYMEKIKSDFMLYATNFSLETVLDWIRYSVFYDMLKPLQDICREIRNEACIESVLFKHTVDGKEKSKSIYKKGAENFFGVNQNNELCIRDGMSKLIPFHTVTAITLNERTIYLKQ